MTQPSESIEHTFRTARHLRRRTLRATEVSTWRSSASLPADVSPRSAVPQADGDCLRDGGGEAYVLEIPVPGLSAEDITIDANADSVTVAIRRQPEEEGSARALHLARAAGTTRVPMFQFPVEIDTTRFERLCRPESEKSTSEAAAGARAIKVNQRPERRGAPLIHYEQPPLPG